jgi:hypothetical protein
MTDKDLNKEFDKLITDVCAPVFKSLGFKKSGTNFFRQTDELIQTFNFQKSPWNNKSQISFTGNVGFIEPMTHLKLHQVETLPKFPKCYESIVQFRLGYLTDGRDYWYTLRSKSNLSDLSAKIGSDLQLVKDVFESHKTLLSLEVYFSDSTKVNPFWREGGQFALYKKLGKDEVARRILLSAYKQAKKPKSWFSVKEMVSGFWKEKKSKPEVNQIWIERLEQVASIYNEPIN